MKNQYFGDINDYRKYGLLRCFARAELRPLLCWMLTADDGSTDGQKRGYLEKPIKWRHRDPGLFDALVHLVGRPDPATVHDICESGLISGATDHATLLEDAVSQRDAYFSALHARLIGDIAFFDPDNGLEVKSVRRGNKSSSKYVYWSELEQVYDAGLSLLVYQHLPRRPREVVAAELIAEATRRLPGCEAQCLSAGAVLFLLIARPEHGTRVVRALEHVEQGWTPAIRRLAPSEQTPEKGIPPGSKSATPLGMLQVTARTGEEPIHAAGSPIGPTLQDLWSWSFSDLVSNASRGVVAEYLVATALGLERGLRAEWDAYDLETPEGIRVEVKSSAYVQTWHQKEPSRISFGIPRTHAWDPTTNASSPTARRQADVYVFCLLAHLDQETIDPLDVTQWRFHVLATPELEEHFGEQSSVSLAAIDWAGAVSVPFSGLATAVRQAGMGRP